MPQEDFNDVVYENKKVNLNHYAALKNAPENMNISRLNKTNKQTLKWLKTKNYVKRAGNKRRNSK